METLVMEPAFLSTPPYTSKTKSASINHFKKNGRMNKLFKLLCGTAMVLLILPSCKKQIINEPLAPDEGIQASVATSAMQAAAANCRPATFAGLFETSSYSHWTNLAQKWYTNGMVTNIKVTSDFLLLSKRIHEPDFNIFWGVVTRQGNQVNVYDEVKGTNTLRVTLDNDDKPVAVYMYNFNYHDNSYRRDTAYLHYTGDRLDSVILLYEFFYGTGWHDHGWEKFVYSYDSYGNVAQIDAKQDSTRYNFTYDYSKPITGTVSPEALTWSLKMLEYLELMETPMHHALTQVDYGVIQSNGNFLQYFPTNYEEYDIDENGLVRSYVHYGYAKLQKKTFYIGWECEDGGMLRTATGQKQNGVTSIEQFRQKYQR